MAESYTPPGSSQSYTVPELSDPADAPQAFRDFADSVPDALDTLTVNPILGNITLEAADEGTMIVGETLNGDLEVTVPDNTSVPLPIGFTVAVANAGGAGNVVKLKKGTGVTIQDQGFLSVEDYRITTLVKVLDNYWLVQAGSATYTPPSGPGAAVFDEGASTGATFSTLTDPDGDGKNYRLATFTSAGTHSLVLTEGGFFQFLLVAGGGGGGSADGGGRHGGAGAGGQVWRKNDAYLDAGTHTVTVGAAGSGTSYPGGAGGRGGSSSIAGFIAVGGGGGGRQNGSLGFGANSGGSASAGIQLPSEFQPYGGGYSGVNAAPAGGGGAGAGGNASSTTGGAARSDDITGAPVDYGKGGSSKSGNTNNGVGGGGNAPNNDSAGGYVGQPGTVYVRVEV